MKILQCVLENYVNGQDDCFYNELLDAGLSSHAASQLIANRNQKTIVIRNKEVTANKAMQSEYSRGDSDADLNVLLQLEGLTRKEADKCVFQRFNCNQDFFYWVTLQPVN